MVELLRTFVEHVAERPFRVWNMIRCVHIKSRETM